EDEAGPLNEEQREYAEISYRNAKRLEMLVGDLLTVSRLDSGRLNMNVERIEIGLVLGQLEEEFRPVAEDKGLALSFATEDGLAVDGDRLRAGQVLSNLISNAIKFSPSGRDVRVRAHRSGEQVIVEVTDQGVGIPAAELPRLTERFFRASTARNVQGTGLGLSISKEIVERQGGRLEIESEEGTGSTFRVALPAAG
ncbi:MAG: HAMP domain-containing histidine kinase, partial [Actinomycetota bacterium]|nr:HAMP domain-containing histidine kinase [Actinomycetota bacterium]